MNVPRPFCKCGEKMRKVYVWHRQGTGLMPYDIVCPVRRFWNFWKHDWRPMEYWDEF